MKALKSIFCCNSQPKPKNKASVYKYEDLIKRMPHLANKRLIKNRQYNYYTDDRQRIITFQKLEQLQISDSRPLENSDLIYACPLCFRYFNCIANFPLILKVILKSSCCSNYICHFCCLEFIETKPNGCHFCQEGECYFIDKNDKEEIKIYSDSQGLQILAQMKKAVEDEKKKEAMEKQKQKKSKQKKSKSSVSIEGQEKDKDSDKENKQRQKLSKQQTE